MILDYIFIYITGALVCSSIMMYWFNTNLPVHIVQILHAAGYRRNDPEFWQSDTPIELWTRGDLNNWKFRTLPAWLDELTECHGCFSFHVAFWVSSSCTLLTWHGHDSLVLFVLACGGWPYISNYALNKLNQPK